MKSIVIILGLLCAVLGFAVYKQASAKHVEAEQLAKECATLSNKVAELTTRMTLTAATNDIAVSNLVSLADRRTAEVHNLSNRLVQTRLLLRATQSDLHTNQTAPIVSPVFDGTVSSPPRSPRRRRGRWATTPGRFP